jgi:hypothetical protein
LRDALFQDARRIVEGLLNDRALVPDDQAPRPHETIHPGLPLQVRTLFGPITLKRNYHHHRKAKTGYAPLDHSLDLTRKTTPALARLICRASSQSGSYYQAAEDLQAYTGLTLDSRRFDRLIGDLAPGLGQARSTLPPETPAPGQSPPAILYASCDGTGIPFRKQELVGRPGKQPDGGAKTREAKLGCIFTQTTTDENGEPIRDPASTSYIGTMGGCREIGTLLHEEALRRGHGRIPQTVYLGDGAPWIWENARLNFPGAVQILDFYHAAEHLGTLAGAIEGPGSKKAQTQQTRWVKKLKKSTIKPILTSVRRLLKNRTGGMTPEQLETVRREIAYFETNARRTRYGDFRERGYFIGSGVIEAGCKTVVGRRMKQSGMFWGESGAEALLGVRCQILGPRFEEAWQARKPILTAQRRKALQWTN